MTNMMIAGLSDQEVVGLTLIGECRGEPIEGQVAVGSVIRNRLHSPNRHFNYRDVCLSPKQFDCWDTTDPNYPVLLDLANKLAMGQKLEDPHLRQCLLIANGVIDWSIVDNTKGATNYMTTEELNSPRRPSWADKPVNPIVYGKHTFFSL